MPLDQRLKDKSNWLPAHRRCLRLQANFEAPGTNHTTPQRRSGSLILLPGGNNSYASDNLAGVWTVYTCFTFGASTRQSESFRRLFLPALPHFTLNQSER